MPMLEPEIHCKNKIAGTGKLLLPAINQCVPFNEENAELLMSLALNFT